MGMIRKKVEMLRDALEITFPSLQRLPRLIKPNPCKIEELPEEVQKLAYDFRESLAEKLGVEPTDIREDYVCRWLEGWLKALLTPEGLKKVKMEWIK